MYAFDEIKHVHIEPTTTCNAECPMCARNARGRVVPGLLHGELSVDDVRRIMPATFLGQIEGLDLCGAYGDPAAASDVIDIVDYVRASSPACAIVIYSNGGLRTPAWWSRLAAAMGPSGKAVFAIDGLEDTNGIHRRNVDFRKVMQNAAAFIAAGGRARWEYLVFRHNEHQVEQARGLSQTIGFAEFSVKKSGRFIEPLYEFVPEYIDHDELNRFPVFDRSGQVAAYLEPPRNPLLVNASVLKLDHAPETYDSLHNLFSRTPIDCRVAATKSVFVSARGLAFPCCWTYVQATRPVMNHSPDPVDYQVADLVERCGGYDRIDAKRVGLKRAVESAFFAAIAESWSLASIEDGRIKVCARACGRDFTTYFDQFADLGLLPRGLQDVDSQAT